MLEEIPAGLPDDFVAAIRFHGHLCGGLTCGYRMARAALEALGVERAQDEELVAIVENDACGVDAVQVLTGCTFGKGNFVFRDYGKHVLTLLRRSDGRAVRVSLRSFDHGLSTGELLAMPTEAMMEVKEVAVEEPPAARIFGSQPCAECGEPTMETRLVPNGDRLLCRECALRLGAEPSA
jgi:formylmethanofuran dehydrogenase subunit E